MELTILDKAFDVEYTLNTNELWDLEQFMLSAIHLEEWVLKTHEPENENPLDILERKDEVKELIHKMAAIAFGDL